MSHRPSARSTILAAVAGISALSAPAAAAGPDKEGRAEATLEMDVRKLDFEGNKKLGLMYMPSSAKLAEEKPADVTKEPRYNGTPRYATITLGNTAHNTYAIAFDEPENKDARIFADLNGNGDLTDDGDGKWAEKAEHDGQAPSYQTTLAFKAHWKDADGKETTGDYALNFYRSPDRDTVNYYRASARTGKITIAGKSYDVMLWENDGDGVFDKLCDPKIAGAAGGGAADRLPKPVTLQLDGDRVDTRGTFGYAGYNYVAHISPDGSKLVMEPTVRQIALPRPVERPTMLQAGGALPEFEVIAWNPDAPKSEDGQPRIETFKLSDFKGKKAIVLDLWATWCGPCMAGIPHISKVAEEVKGQDVVVIALNVWDEQKAFDRFAKEKGSKYAFRLARDPAGKEHDASIASRIFKLSGIPATYVIDKSGKIVEAISGYEKDDKSIEYALVRLGYTVDGIKPEDAAKSAKPKDGPAKMIPATGMR